MSPMIFSFFISGAYDSSDEHLALEVTCSAGFQPQTDTLAPGHCRTSQPCSVFLCLALMQLQNKRQTGDEPDHDWNLRNNTHGAERNFFTFSDPCRSQPWPNASRRDKKPPCPSDPQPVEQWNPIGLFSDVFPAEKGNSSSLSWLTLCSVKQAHMCPAIKFLHLRDSSACNWVFS